MGALMQVCRNESIALNEQGDIETMPELDYNRQSTYSKLTGLSAKFLNGMLITTYQS